MLWLINTPPFGEGLRENMKEKLVFNSECNDAPENRLMLGGNTTGIANLNSVKYKWASQLYKIMLNNFWIPEKIISALPCRRTAS